MVGGREGIRTAGFLVANDVEKLTRCGAATNYVFWYQIHMGNLGKSVRECLWVPLEGPTLRAGGVLAPELCLLPPAFLDYCRSDSEGRAVPRLSPGATDLVSHEPAEPATHSLQS
jgi:hypothetical protein